MNRWIALAPLAVLGVLAVLFAGYGLHHDPHVNPAALVGKPVPDVRLPGLDGGHPVRLKSQLSGPTFINVFASWCVPCVVEAPALAAMKAQGARIVGVTWEDDPAASKRFLAQNGDPFSTVLVDRNGRAGIELGVSGVPETFLVGANGVILAKHSGPLQPEDAEALLDQAQGGPKPR